MIFCAESVLRVGGQRVYAFRGVVWRGDGTKNMVKSRREIEKSHTKPACITWAFGIHTKWFKQCITTSIDTLIPLVHAIHLSMFYTILYYVWV